MITKQTIREEFDEKFSKNSGGIINFIDPMSEDMNVTSHKIKSFYDSKIQSLLEQIMLEYKNEMSNEMSLYEGESLWSNGYNHAIADLKKNIINAGFEVK